LGCCCCTEDLFVVCINEHAKESDCLKISIVTSDLGELRWSDGNKKVRIDVHDYLAIIVLVVDTTQISGTEVLMDTFTCACCVSLCRAFATNVFDEMHRIVLFWKFEVLLVFDSN
jgi:hypothetical protein